MFQLPYNCTHFIYLQGNTQNPSSEASAVQWTKTFQVCKLGFEKAEEPEIKLPTSAGL